MLATGKTVKKGFKGNSLDETVGINITLIDVVAVQNVSSEAGQLHAVDHFRRARPRLGILASHAANADDALIGAPDEHQTHLKQQLDLGLDGALLAVVEQLGAVAALQQKGISLGDLAQVSFQGVDLTGVDQRRHPRELGGGLLQLGGVGIGGRLLDGL